jgi:lipoprotein-anchoring transpeptidase ErfK/SrfK
MLGAGALMLKPWQNWTALSQTWPDAEKLGRNCTDGWITLRSRPTTDSQDLGKIYEDTVVVWLREVVGAPVSLSRRWVETPDGYLYAPSVQPVHNRPNSPVREMPVSATLGRGMWVEVTVPYVDIYPANAPCSAWLQEAIHPRLYYSQVIWVDDVRQSDSGQIMYRVNELYGNCGDIYWAAAEAFRPLTDEDLSPIHAEASDKKIVVDVNHQTLTCYEGKQEVYFCRISSGAKFDASGNVVEKWATPGGQHLPWRKTISLHMAGGSTGAGWDTPGIAWTILFDPKGAAIHSTFWHNDFGVPRSHGCVNASPEDSKWVFRWASPTVTYDPGDVSLSGPVGTIVDVVG